MINIFSIHHKPDKKNLKKFGCVLGMLLLFLFGFIYPFFFKKDFLLCPIFFGAAFVALAYLMPYVFKPIFILFSIIGNILGPINQFLLMLFIFYIIIFPINFILWLFRYDPMKRVLDRKAATYRIINKRAINIEEPF